MAFCGNCGYNAQQSKFCPECGSKVAGSGAVAQRSFIGNTESPPPPPPPPRRVKEDRPSSAPSNIRPSREKTGTIGAPPPPPPPSRNTGASMINTAVAVEVPPAASGEEAQAVFKLTIKKVRQAADGNEDTVQQFKSNCKLYGQGKITAENFYSDLSTVIGQQATATLFPDLARLIPDDDKRYQLLMVHAQQQEPKGRSKKSIFGRASSSTITDGTVTGGVSKKSALSTKGHYNDHPLCDICNISFDVLGKRRHQCRMCASYVCTGCSPVFLLIPPGQQAPGAKNYDPAVPQRVCTVCAPLLHEHQDSLRATYAAAEKENPHEAKLRLHVPYSSSLEKECRDAADIVGNFFRTELGSNVDRAIPVQFLQKANGLAILKIIKAGFLFSGKLGTGIVVSKLPDGTWSAPSAIGTAGLSWGLVVGGEIVELLIILGSAGAVKVFTKPQVNIGGGLDVAVGPVGRSAAAGASLGMGGLGVNYSYSHARGLYGGISLEGAVILTRNDLNRKFYGQDVDPEDLLLGRVEAPRAAQPLYEALDAAAQGIEDYREEKAKALAARGPCGLCGCDHFVESKIPFDPKCKMCKHKH